MTYILKWPKIAWIDEIEVTTNSSVTGLGQA